MDQASCQKCRHRAKPSENVWCAQFVVCPESPVCPHHTGMIAFVQRQRRIVAAVVLDNQVSQAAKQILLPHLTALGLEVKDPLVQLAFQEIRAVAAQGQVPEQLYAADMQALLEEERRKVEGWSAVGRNDPCPCGSKKKFKKCCGAGGGEASGNSETKE